METHRNLPLGLHRQLASRIPSQLANSLYRQPVFVHPPYESTAPCAPAASSFKALVEKLKTEIEINAALEVAEAHLGWGLPQGGLSKWYS